MRLVFVNKKTGEMVENQDRYCADANGNVFELEFDDNEGLDLIQQYHFEVKERPNVNRNVN